MVHELIVIMLMIIWTYPGMAVSKIIHIASFEQFLNEIDQNTLILLDIDHTLIESRLTLGSQQWNLYLKNCIEADGLDADLYGQMTFWIAQNVPVRPVEKSIPSIIQQLIQDHMVLGFTARGVSNWNHATISDVDQFTSQQLASVDIYLQQPLCLTRVPEVSLGVIFTNQQLKGPVLKKILTYLEPKPAKIVFVDDNRQHLESAEEMMLHHPEIAFVGCHYTFLTDNSPSLDFSQGNDELHALIDSIFKVPLPERSLPFLIQFLCPYVKENALQAAVLR